MGSTFQAQIDGHFVIPGTHTSAGGTTNFNFSCPHRKCSIDTQISQLIPTEPSAQPRRPFSTVPFAQDPDFVERPEILAWVRDKCAGPGARAALVGLGGVGCVDVARPWLFCYETNTSQ